MYTIYKITNLINNKIYIGQTNDFRMRQYQYKSAALNDHTNMVIVRAMKKYGYENFKFEAIATCKNLDDSNFTEVQVIAQYDSMNLKLGYNLDPGGGSHKRGEETIKRIKEGLLNYYKDNDHVNKGKSLTDEWKKAISKASMGKPGTNKGKTFSDEWRLKISQAQIEKRNSGYVQAKNSNKQKFTKDQQKEICDLYLDGETSVTLSRKYNCAKNTIISCLKRNNIDIRPSNNKERSVRNIFTVEKEIEIMKVYNEGKSSYSSLSKIYKCDADTIKKIIERQSENIKKGL